MQILRSSCLDRQAFKQAGFYALAEKTSEIYPYCRNIEMKKGGFGENVKGAGALIALVPLHLLLDYSASRSSLLYL